MKNMIINVKKTTMVLPARETPSGRLWSSNLDLIVRRAHTPVLHLYRPSPTGSSTDKFFNLEQLKDGLSRALVHYYPVAGRLTTDQDGRLEVDCNADGVLFIEAETTSSILDDFVDVFAPTSGKINKLIPTIDYSGGISSIPLFAAQITRFKCGGVALGIAMHHILGDGFASINFMQAWCEMTRGLDDITIHPFMDRTILRARDPPRSKFHHIEFQPPPALNTPTISEGGNIACSVLKFTREHINTLRSKVEKSATPVSRYSSFEILAGHVWVSVCKARGLTDDQKTKLTIPTNARFRPLVPPLPTGYLGNAIFLASPIGLAGDLISQPLSFSVSKIHDCLARVDNEYMRSALDYLELQPDLEALVSGGRTSPNFKLTCWTKFPVHCLDFGWGQPIFMAPGAIGNDGSGYLFQSPNNDGSLYLAIGLLNEREMKLFSQYVYEI